MYIFFVSLRTSEIFGPAQVDQINNPSATIVEFTGSWLGPEELDDWEGYAVCVPEQKRVWGKAYPEVNNKRVKVRMVFNPQDMPPKDLKIFDEFPHKEFVQDSE